MQNQQWLPASVVTTHFICVAHSRQNPYGAVLHPVNLTNVNMIFYCPENSKLDVALADGMWQNLKQNGMVIANTQESPIVPVLQNRKLYTDSYRHTVQADYPDGYLEANMANNVNRLPVYNYNMSGDCFSQGEFYGIYHWDQKNKKETLIHAMGPQMHSTLDGHLQAMMNFNIQNTKTPTITVHWLQCRGGIGHE